MVPDMVGLGRRFRGLRAVCSQSAATLRRCDKALHQRQLALYYQVSVRAPGAALGSFWRRGSPMANLRPQRRAGTTSAFAGGASGLGPLETSVVEQLWRGNRALTVRHVQLAFPDLAYTTLMTTLDRLYRKGVLIRRRCGRAFTYEPRCSREELLGEMLSGQVTALLAASGTSGAVLSTLVDVVGRTDAALLDELEALVQATRERLKVEDR